MPAIRILLKRSAAEDQELGMNRIDFERAGGTRKSGYKFVLNLIGGKPDAFYSGNDLVQSFIAIIQDDELIQQHLLKNDYTFTFTSKYQLQIKNTSITEEAETALPVLAEEAFAE